MSTSATEAKKVVDAYGLSYMAAKNVIGPLSITIIYFAIMHGVGAGNLIKKVVGSSSDIPLGMLESGGSRVGRMALASYLSTILFPFVVFASALLGPLMHTFFTSIILKMKSKSPAA
jgi:hypothetical protein